MASARPSIKRSATSTSAVPRGPARRPKLVPMSSTVTTQCRPVLNGDWPWISSQQQVAAEIRNTENIWPAVPTHLDVVTHRSELHPISETRNEFPFPRQPIPRPPTYNKHLSIAIPDHDPDFDVPKNTGLPNQPRPPLPTPPRSQPSISSPPSSRQPSLASQPAYPQSCLETPPPTPTNSSFSADPYSPCATDQYTPLTPASVFSSAAHSLKQIVMADDLGMSVSSIQQLDDFASMSVSKRAGRVLARSSVTQTRRQQREVSRGQGQLRSSGSQAYDAGTWWREINWSRFSDDSSEEDEGSEGTDSEAVAGAVANGEKGVSRSGYRRRRSRCMWLPPDHAANKALSDEDGAD